MKLRASSAPPCLPTEALAQVGLKKDNSYEHDKVEVSPDSYRIGVKAKQPIFLIFPLCLSCHFYAVILLEEYC